MGRRGGRVRPLGLHDPRLTPFPSQIDDPAQTRALFVEKGWSRVVGFQTRNPIARKNYGCSHFILGRDHAGVGSYYGTYDAQELFNVYAPGELGIAPLCFENAFYSTTVASMATAKTAPGDASTQVNLSGTKVREMLSRGELPPVEFSRPEVAKILIDSMREKAPA